MTATATVGVLPWQRYSNCRTHDPDLWFSTDQRDQHTARSVCATCPVRTMCLDTALELEGTAARVDRHGIRGGMGPRARYAEYRRRLAAAGRTTRPAPPNGGRRPAPCGTRAARSRHRRNGETCTTCGTGAAA